MTEKIIKKIVFLFVLTLSVVFSVFIYMQTRLYNEYALEEKRLETELAKERGDLNILLKEKENYLSDSYVEKIAREKLGLVRQDEIVFINDAVR